MDERRGQRIRLTGGLDGPPAWGQGKADAVRDFCRSRKLRLRASFGYANGDEDIAFLRSVGHATAVQPKEELQRVAKQAGWPILRFDARRRGSAQSMARTVGAYGAMGVTFLAGLGLERMTGDTRKAVDLITSVSADAALAVLGVKVEVLGEALVGVELRRERRFTQLNAWKKQQDKLAAANEAAATAAVAEPEPAADPVSSEEAMKAAMGGGDASE